MQIYIERKRLYIKNVSLIIDQLANLIFKLQGRFYNDLVRITLIHYALLFRNKYN